MLVKTQNWFSHRHSENVQHSPAGTRKLSVVLYLTERFRQKQNT